MRPSSLLVVAVAAVLAAGVIMKSLPPIKTDGARQTAGRTVLAAKSVYGAGVALPNNMRTPQTGLLSLP
jgi:hypothetical protein